MSEYQHQKDFIAFLRSPTTNNIEYENKIKADRKLIDQYENLLKEKKITFRKSPLDIFPPPVGIVIEDTSIEESLKVLLAWYSNNKSRNPEVTIVDGAGEISKIQSESDLNKVLNIHVKK